LLDGGTSIASAFNLLNQELSVGDNVILISDNQSWGETRCGATATMTAWEEFLVRNKGARLACIDLQPYGSVQVAPRNDVLHVGGFSDAVFDLLASFAAGQMGSDYWEKEIEAIIL
jgi:60 kDa SS-A/Ro ribonucleoprotein